MSRSRLALLSVHPAPYRDPLFERIKEERGDDVQIITLFRDPATHPEWNRGGATYDTHVLRETAPTRGRLTVFPRLPRILRDGDFGSVLVPGHAPLGSLHADIWTLAHGLKLIYSADTIATRQTPNPRALQRHIASRASALWVPGAASRSMWSRAGIPEERVFQGSYTLSAGEIDRALEGKEDEVRSIKRDLGLEEKFVYLFVGNLLPSRRPDWLLQAYEKVRTDDTALVVVGGGAMAEEVDHYAAAKPRANVRRIAPVPFAELHKYYAMASCYVHPGAEPYSLAVQEAALLGLPIVSSRRVGAAWDYASPQDNGVEFDFDSPRSLEAALDRAKTMVPSRSAADNARARGVDFAMDQFTQMIDSL